MIVSVLISERFLISVMFLNLFSMYKRTALIAHPSEIIISL